MKKCSGGVLARALPVSMSAGHPAVSMLFKLFLSIFPFYISLSVFPVVSNIFASLCSFLSVAAFLFSFYLVCNKNLKPFCDNCFLLELCDKGTAGSNSDDNDHIDFYFERATFILLERGED